MFWSDDDDEDFLADTDGWRAWAITFYGHIPRYDKESEGGLVLTDDALLTSLDWRFPRVMAEGWVAFIYANNSVIREIDLSEEPIGRSVIGEKMALLRGSKISARIFFANDDADFVPLSAVNHTFGQGYSITVNGVQQNDIPIVVENEGEVDNTNAQFAQWQMDWV